MDFEVYINPKFTNSPVYKYFVGSFELEKNIIKNEGQLEAYY